MLRIACSYPICNITRELKVALTGTKAPRVVVTKEDGMGKLTNFSKTSPSEYPSLRSLNAEP